MLANPMQNQDMLQRSETVSEMRNLEQGKVMGDAAYAASHMRRKEALKHETVQRAESFALDPDAKNPSEEQGQNPERNSEEKKESSEEQGSPTGHPRKLLGGDHLDILA